MRKPQRDKLVAEGRAAFDEALEADSENREKAREDLEFAFADEGQWDERVRADRKDRPCFTFNRIEPVIDQIVGDQRQSRPQIKLRPVGQADKAITDTFAGLIRNIEALSDADTVYDRQFLYAVAAGGGNWRIVNEYCDDTGFDQELFIRGIANPFAVHWDPRATDPTKSDARYCFIESIVPKDDFEAQFPKAKSGDWDGDDLAKGWAGDDGIRVVEWYRKVPKQKRLLLMTDGRVVDADEVKPILDELAAAGITVERERTVQGTVIRWVKMTGAEILEGPVDYNWKWIPVIHCAGKEVNIGGRTVRKGIVRNARDAQQSYNYAQSKIAERVLLSPSVDFVLTPKNLAGFTQYWDKAHKQNFPYLPINPDPGLPGGMLPRMPAAAVPTDLLALAQQNAEDIRATTNYYGPSLGQPDNATSGKAIMARQKEGDVGSFVYVDHLSKAIQHTGRVLLDMIPDIYDTERQVRILGDDGTEQFVTINSEVPDQQTGETVLVKDRSRAKFDVRVTVGPSYTTQRQEAAERLMQMVAAWPELAGLAGDLIVKGLDFPEAGELESRIRKALVRAGTIEPKPEEMPEPQPPSEAEQLALATAMAKLEGMQLDNQKKAAEDDKVLTEIRKTQAETLEILRRLRLPEASLTAA
jgi:hypothetical protein